MAAGLALAGLVAVGLHTDLAGGGNRVAVDNTDAVSASGTGNVVVYHWGSPRVVNAGTTNIVRQG